MTCSASRSSPAPGGLISGPCLHPPVFAISGTSGSGKTELICRLLTHWRGEFRQVAVIKHSHHQPVLDIPGKDTWRFRTAGAQSVALAAPGLISLFEVYPDDPPLTAILGKFTPSTDLVLLEGYKRSPIPKLVLVPPESDLADFQDWPQVVGFVSEQALETPLPVFGRDHVAAIAAFILECVA